MRHDPASGDHAACLKLLRKGSKSFAVAARLLPRRVRVPATVLYALCRVIDDAIDEAPDATDATVSQLLVRVDRAYAGHPADFPVDRAFSAVALRERVPRMLIEALLEGMLWDARGRRYETLDELIAYAARVAGTVGVMMTLVMGRREAGVLARACDLGVAMQLTNIARDVGDDARRGRLYLPLSWMREANVDPEGFLSDPRPSAALARVIARLLSEADVLYRRADLGIDELPRDCRAAIRAARLIYADIGRSVARAGWDSVTRRAVVSPLRKLAILIRAALTGRSALLDRGEGHANSPPLEETRFLVDACAEPS